ncbi:MAG: TonB-dependent receptor [Acidobacteriota bacterium]
MRRATTSARASILLLLICTLTAIYSTEPVIAQDGSAIGRIDGVVIGNDDTGLLEGARAHIEGTRFEAYSNSQGYFVLRDVPVGTYRVEISFVGAPSVAQEVEVASGATTSVTVNLEISGGGNFSEEILVVAPEKSKALNVEIAAVEKVSVISADKAGTFPDINAAEAIQRLPGLYMDNDRGEGRFVSVRGAPSSFNRVKLNGMSLGSPESNGLSVPLDVFPAAQLSQIEVTKSVLPSQDANSVGGEINLVTPTAFGSGKSNTSVNLQAGQHDLSDRFRGGSSASHARVFGDSDQYGFQIHANYDQSNPWGETVEASDWDRTDDIPGFEDVEPLIVDDIELRNQEVTRERWGVGTTLEWKPSHSTRYYGSISFNRFVEDEYRDRFVHELDDRGDVATDRPIVVSPPSGSESDGGIPTVTRVTFEDLSRIEREWQNDYTPQDFTVFSGGGEITRRNWLTDFRIGYSDTSEERTRDVLEYRLASGSIVEFDATADPLLPRLTHLGGPDPYDPSAYNLNLLRLRRNFRFDEVLTVSSNASFYKDLERGSLWTTFGARATIRSREHDTSDDRWEPGAIDISLADDRFLRPEANGSLLDGTYNYGPSVDRGRIGDLFRDRDTLLEFQVEDSFFGELEDDYQADEDVYAAYLQTEYRIGNWTILGGLRFEQTDFTVDGFGVLAPESGDDQIVPVSNASSYSDVFPGLHLRWAPAPDVVVRASWANTIRRPNFNALIPASQIDEEDQQIDAGNPDLEPFESSNIDLSLDVYSKKWGVFGIALFRKDIEGFLIDTEDQVVGGPFDGFALFSIANGEDGFLQGIDLTYTKTFRSGFAVDLNATFTDSEVGLDFRQDETLPLEGQTDLTGSLSLSYTHGKFFGRLAYKLVDPFVDSIGNPGEDQFEIENERLGLKLIYTLNERYALSAQADNLNDQHLEVIRGDRLRLRENERNGWRGSLGLTLRY